ncbi:MAG TPA: site-2 protease family protein [Leptolyngbyaceae cyanobacterium]
MAIILSILWLYVSIFCHEMGHFIVAKTVGFQPYLIIVGSGSKILSFKLGNSVFEFRTIPSGGITYTANLTLNKVKNKLALMYLAGPVVNLCFCLFFTIIYVKSISHLEAPEYLNSIVFIICIEFTLFVSSILPMDIKLYGRVISNDGKQLINAVTKTEQQFIQTLLGLDRYTNNKTSSPDLFNNDLKVLQKLYKAQAEFNQSNFAQAIELFEEILNYPGIPKRDQLYIIDILASIVINYGEVKYLNKADQWSAHAIELSRDITTIQGTRGAILIELGRYSEGKEMLLPLTEKGNEVIDIAVSCCYIAKADYYLGNEDKVKDWLNKAEKVGAAPLVLWRVKKEINYL